MSISNKRCIKFKSFKKNVFLGHKTKQIATNSKNIRNLFTQTFITLRTVKKNRLYYNY